MSENGSPDPKKNSKLAQVIQQAKDSKVPMATIERTLTNLQVCVLKLNVILVNKKSMVCRVSIVHFKVKKSCPMLFSYPRQMVDLCKVNH